LNILSGVYEIMLVGGTERLKAVPGSLVQEAMATSWGKDNIQANSILPGWLNTDLLVTTMRDNPVLKERILDRRPLGRCGEPEDPTGIAIFLASSASNFVTGTAIPLDGGYSVMI